MGAIAGIGAGLGAAGGLIGGLRGTPDQKQFNTSVNQTTFDPKTKQEESLLTKSINQFNLGRKLETDFEKELANYDPIQQAAIKQQIGLLTGQAFNLTPQEQMQLGNLRQSMVAQGSADINKLLDERMKQTLSNAGTRGLRGQALAELQGRNIDTAAEEMGRLQNQANQIYAQQAMQLPFQRLQAQAGAANTGLTLQQQLQQQAINNRMQSQNPFALQMMMDERLRGGKTTSNSNSLQPGQKGGLLSGITGAIGGGLGGFSTVAGAQQMFNNAGLMNQYNDIANRQLSDMRVQYGMDTAGDWA